MNTDDPFPSMPADSVPADPVERVIRYHLRTKHHFNRYARALGFLDWANQPDPFRRFEGAPLVPLPLLKPEDEPRSPSYDAIYRRRRHGFPSQPVTINTLSRFLECALALSAWKRAGDTEWALRSNPSSGNLHPTEGYLLLPPMDQHHLPAGLYHYAPKEHVLERRATIPVEQIGGLFRGFPRYSFLFGLTSVHWRESWKYGERAFRYCNHDVGHAIGSARIAAATLGWNMILLDGTDQHTVATLLGTDRREDYVNAEPEHPDCLALVWPIAEVSREEEAEDSDQEPKGQCERAGEDKVRSIPLYIDPAAVKGLSGAIWHGRANRLSRENPVPWEIIDDAAAASWKSTQERHSLAVPCDEHAVHLSQPEDASGLMNDATLSALRIIRQRRSAVAFDGKTSIPAAAFFQMLLRVMPSAERPCLERPMPWDAIPWDPTIHLLLFVHRIDGLMPGLYVLARDPRKVTLLQQAMNPELEWTAAPDCPPDLPLYWLLQGDARRLAAQVSCHQDIAGDSAFSLGMLAEFEALLHHGGAWWYPRLFWESGVVGQVLYLEAEAAGVRGTGIGCFFDDPVHEIVGIKGLAVQSLYHFTIGGAVEDVRLQTLLPYYHVTRRS